MSIGRSYALAGTNSNFYQIDLRANQFHRVIYINTCIPLTNLNRHRDRTACSAEIQIIQRGLVVLPNLLIISNHFHKD